MTEALATTQGPISAEIERVLIGGDLSQLTPPQRVSYYNAVCQSLGLNPLTKPFSYITLNGKLTLYALRDCTEQLRKIHKVSITKVEPKQIGDLFVVVSSAVDGEGRVDSSTGAVNIKGLGGENLANAMMKCETKAKRRVTLSLCGLGLLDETEVDTLRQQGLASEITTVEQVLQAPTEPVQADPNAEPDIKPRSKKGSQPSTEVPTTQQEPSQRQEEAPEGRVVSSEPTITIPQGKRFFAISRSAGLSDEQVKERLAEIGYHGHRDDIPRSLYEKAVDAIDPEMQYHTNKK